MTERRKERWPIDPENSPFTVLINRIHRISRQHMDEGALKLGLQPGFRRIHLELIHNDGCAQRFLAEKTSLSAPTVSIALGKMENDGLVRREVDGADSRRSKVYLTEKGRALDQSMRTLFCENEERVTATLTEEEQAQLRTLLCRIITHLEETEESEEKR